MRAADKLLLRNALTVQTRLGRVYHAECYRGADDAPEPEMYLWTRKRLGRCWDCGGHVDREPTGRKMGTGTCIVCGGRCLGTGIAGPTHAGCLSPRKGSHNARRS